MNEDLRWQQRAACKERADDVHFPPTHNLTSTEEDRRREAKTQCGFCPVRAECLRYALDNDIQWGIWGGLTERERRRVAKAEKKRRRLASVA